MSWNSLNKFPGLNANQVPAGAFYEGGINLTDLLPSGTAAPCFASFLLETRASQSVTSTLKDFLLGAFPQCHVSVSKTYTCQSFNADNTLNYSYTDSVINDGGGDLTGVQVVDSPTGGSAVTYSCNGTLKQGSSFNFPSTDCPQPSGTTNTVTNLTAHPATNVADASACTGSLVGGNCLATIITATTGSVSSGDATSTSCVPQVGISVAKRCVTAFQASGSEIVVRVDYTGEVANTGTLNITTANVTDDKGGGPFSVGALSVGQAKCYTNNAIVSSTTGCPTLTAVDGVSSTPTGAASYFPTGADALGLIAGRIQFTDTVTATGTASNGASVGPATASASCVICPFGSCPAQ